MPPKIYVSSTMTLRVKIKSIYFRHKITRIPFSRKIEVNLRGLYEEYIFNRKVDVFLVGLTNYVSS